MAFNLPGIPSGKPAANPAINKKPAQNAPKLPPNNKTVPKTETGPNKPGYVPPALIGNGMSDASDSSSESSSTDTNSGSEEQSSNGTKKKRQRRGKRKPNQSNMNRQNRDTTPGRGDSGYGSGSRSAGNINTSGSELIFNKSGQSRGFGQYIGIDKTNFNLKVKNTLSLNEFEKASVLQGNIQPQLLFNMGKFSTGLAATEGYVADQFNIVYYRYVNEVFAKIKSSFNSVLTLTNFRDLCADMAEALSLFFYIDSTLSYRGVSSKDAKDNNKCMLIYQQQFNTFNILNKHSELGKTLLGMWFPPMFAELIRHTYQTFKLTPNDRSALFRFVPNSSFIYNDNTPFSESAVTAALDNAISQLNTETNCKLSSILCDVMPVGRILQLPPSVSNSNFDPNMVELFANMPTIWWNDSIATPAVDVFPKGSTDIAYFFDGKLEDHNSFPFALTNIKAANGTDAVGLFTTRHWDATTSTDKCNKQTCYTKYTSGVESLTMIPRVDPSAKLGIPDVHQVAKVVSGSTITYNLTSHPVYGWNRGYYVNATSPEVVLGEVLSMLFGLKL